MARRLSAIFAADIVGYSRLISLNEQETVDRLNLLYKQLVRPEIENRYGRTVKLMGDGLLAEFSSVIEAVNCAICIQKSLTEREANVADDRRFRLRIGINLGDIIVSGADIHGDGVNVAARLEALSEPEGVCISQSVFDQIQNRVDVTFEDIGPQKVKNIDRPIQAYQWNISGVVNSRKTLSTAGDQTQSIAILPFKGMSADPAHEFLADGISEEISTAMSKIPGLLVLAQQSTQKYKSLPLDVQSVATEQGASHILHGSLRVAGDRVRVNANLIESKSGVQLWAERYDRKLDDVFELQDEISLQIASAMLGEIGEGEMARLRARGTRNLQSWSLHLNATALMRNLSNVSNTEARRLVEQALALDPDYSSAMSTLALTHAMDARHGFTKDRNLSINQAKTAALNAINLDPRNAEAYGVLGFVDNLQGHIKDAIEKFKSALQINPNHAEVCIRMALTLIFNGQPKDALNFVERAKQLSPRHPPWYFGVHGFALRALGQYQQAIPQFQEYGRQVEGFGHVDLAIVYSMMGDLEKAKAEARNILKYRPDFSTNDWSKTQLYSNPDDVQPDVDALKSIGLPVK